MKEGSLQQGCALKRRQFLSIGGAAVSQFVTVLEPAVAAEEDTIKPKFDPGPVKVGWQIYFGAAAGVFPFLIGSWEFGKRIVIQRRCPICEGSGLITRGAYKLKCNECGGFFPWEGWGKFFSATTSPGNGGILRQPKGQKSIFYTVPEMSENPPKPDSDEHQTTSQEHSDKVDSEE